MANKTISDLTAITTVDEADLFELEDVSVPQGKKVTLADLRTSILNHATSLVLKSASTTRLTISTSTITSTLVVLGPDGSQSAPTYSFSSDSGNGMYLSTTDTLAWTTNGTLRLSLSTASLTSTLPFLAPNGTAGAPSFAFSSETDTGLYQTGTANEIGISAGGTGRAKVTTTSIEPITDNAISFGVSGKRWSDGYFTTTHVGDLVLKDPDGGAAHWRIVEGLDEIFATNERTGRKYRLAMTEVT